MIGYGSESGAKDLTSTTRPLATIGSKTPQWVLFMVLPGASSQWRIATLSDVESLRGENRGTLRRNSDLLSVFFLRRKEDERTDLDTFARRCIGRTRRVVESGMGGEPRPAVLLRDRKSTRLNSSHVRISYAVFCLKKKKTTNVL